MAKQVDVDEILARNPHIDPERLEEARELLRQLRKRGVRQKGYDLAPPYGGRRAVAEDEAPEIVPLVRSGRPPATA